MAKTPNDEHKSKPAASAVLGAYQTHINALKRFVLRFLNSKHDVDDVVQEAFLRAYNVERDKEIAQPKSYLFRVAKNVALNQLRQKTRRPTDFLEDSDSSEILDSNWTLEDEIMAQQKLEIHCAAVAALPSKCRKVYLMRKVYDMSYKEMADALGITVSTVETHLEKGFARCAAYVEERMDESEEGNHQLERKPGA